MAILNKKIAESLGMEIPSDDTNQKNVDAIKALTVISPHELAVVNNPDLPEMADIDIKLAEGEKQLEQVIVSGLVQMQKMFANAETTSPDKVARYLEVASITMSQTLTAIMHKTKLQLEKKKMRMAEHSYTPSKKDTKDGQTTNNLFIGSREDAMAMLEKQLGK